VDLKIFPIDGIGMLYLKKLAIPWRFGTAEVPVV